MSKQDRQGVRTAQALEQKYNLGDIGKQGGELGKQNMQMSQLTQMVSQFMATTNAEIAKLRKELLDCHECKGVQLWEELPKAQKKYRGVTVIIETNGTDAMYVCMKKEGIYRWIELGTSTGTNVSTGILGQAELGLMVLGGQ